MPSWSGAVYNALDGERLRDAVIGTSEIYLLVGSLNMGGMLTLSATEIEPLHQPYMPYACVVC